LHRPEKSLRDPAREGRARLADRLAGVCTVLLRFRPATRYPVLLAAVRDEFLERPWDPPGAHWPHQPGIVGGRDRLSGGTWLAVDPAERRVAAILNGAPLPAAPRPTRGGLPLAALRESDPIPADIADYDTFHLLRVDGDAGTLWSWDGRHLSRQELPPGDHIIVNLGLDTAADPLVPHFAPLFAALPDPSLAAGADTASAWGGWVDLLRGDGLDPGDPRALIVAHEFGGRHYGSGSASLVALGEPGVRYDFTPHPDRPAWAQVEVTLPELR
jgi:Transport and Golgi organisation 2